MYSNRFVIDEQLFQFKDQQEQVIEENLLDLANLLEQFQEEEIEVILPKSWQSIRYLDDDLFVNQLYSENIIERDLRIRLQRHLNKCVEIDVEKESGIDSVIELQKTVLHSYGISFAFHKNVQNYATAIITVNYMKQSSVEIVVKNKKESEVYFIKQFNERINFFRSIFHVDNIKEVNFFTYTREAFPNLIFSRQLNFNKFKGTYESLRSLAIEHLSALNDHFIAAFDSEKGLPDNISTMIGISVSIESGKTRASNKKMKLREVEFQGMNLMCEWHSKFEPHQNRIHFCPIPNEDNARLFIGIFVDHLPT